MRQLELWIVRNHSSSSVGSAAEQCTVIKTCVILWHYYRYTEFIVANNDVRWIPPWRPPLPSPPDLCGNEVKNFGKKLTCLHFAECMSCDQNVVILCTTCICCCLFDHNLDFNIYLIAASASSTTSCLWPAGGGWYEGLLESDIPIWTGWKWYFW